MHTKKKSKNIDYKKLTLLVIAIGIILRFILASLYTVSGDSCWHLSVARFIGENNKIPLFENLGRDSVFSRGPLFHIIGAVFFKVFNIFGQDAANFSLKMVSPFFGSLTLLIFYYLVRKFYNDRVTFIAVAVLAFLPLHLYYSTISYIDSTLVFFVLLAIFLMVNDRLVFASIAAGASVLLKIEGLFIIPLLLFILFHKNRHDTKSFIRKGLLFLAVSFLIYVPLFIRNIVYLGNPVWPFLYQILGGYPLADDVYSRASLGNLLSTSNLVTPYLELFGVPNGNYTNLFFFNIPFIGILIAAWLTATLVYFSFFVYGLAKADKSTKANIFCLLWIGTYVMFLLLTIIFTNLALGRYLISALPAVALIITIGMNKILETKKLKTVVLLFIVLANIGFVFAEFAKANIASRSWQPYQKDFEWIMENTGEGSTVFYLGQCLAYNTKRFTIYPMIPLTKKYVVPEKSAELEEAYVWVNQEFKVDPQSILPQNMADSIEKDYKLVYYNEKTKTRLYKIN